MGLLESTLQGLGYAGDAIDKLGGRPLRGVLGGHPHEILSAIPFSDTLGITRYKDRVSGRDLTDQWGLTRKGDDTLGSHALGMGAEMLLDPLNLAGGGFLAHAAGKRVGAAAREGELGEHIGKFLADEAGTLNPSEVGDWVRRGTEGTGLPVDAIHYGDAMRGTVRDVGDTATRLGVDPENVRRFRAAVRRDAASVGKAASLTPRPDDLADLAAGHQRDFASMILDPLAATTGRDVSPEFGEPILDAFRRMASEATPPARPHARSDEFLGSLGAHISQLPADPVLHHKLTRDLLDRGVPALRKAVGDTQGNINRSLDFVGSTPLNVKMDRLIDADLPFILNEIGNPAQVGNAKKLASELTALEQSIGGREFPGKLWLPSSSQRGGRFDLGGQAAKTLDESIREILADGPRHWRNAMAPTYVDDSIHHTIDKAASKFANTHGPEMAEHQGFARKFFAVPEIPRSAKGVNAATAFAREIGHGTDAAKDYYSPLYYHINKYLRDLGPNGRLAADDLRRGVTPDYESLLADAARRSPAPALTHSPTNAAHAPDAAAQVLPEEMSVWGNFLDDDDLPPGPLPALHSPEPMDADTKGEVEGVIARLMGLFEHSRMPQDMDLWRGVDAKGLHAIESQIGGPLSSSEAIGKEFTDPAFLSTANHPETARAFAGLQPGYNRPDPGVYFHMPKVKEGTPASFMNATENEILHPPGRRIRIEDNSKYPEIKVSLLDHLGTLLNDPSAFLHADPRAVLAMLGLAGGGGLAAHILGGEHH